MNPLTYPDILRETPTYRNTVEFLCTAPYALFSDPVYRVGGEKCTLQIPTYEALKGILASVYWKPTIIWIIDAVRVLNPIQTEVKGIRTIRMTPKVKDGKISKTDLSYYTYLKDPAYQVRAHFIFNENHPELVKDRNEHKHHNVARRMIEEGGRRDIFLGTRECQGYVEPCTFGAGTGSYDTIPLHPPQAQRHPRLHREGHRHHRSAPIPGDRAGRKR